MVVSLKSSGATMLLLHLFVAGPTLALKLPSVMPKVWGKGRTTTAASIRERAYSYRLGCYGGSGGTRKGAPTARSDSAQSSSPFRGERAAAAARISSQQRK